MGSSSGLATSVSELLYRYTFLYFLHLQLFIIQVNFQNRVLYNGVYGLLIGLIECKIYSNRIYLKHIFNDLVDSTVLLLNLA